MILHIGYMKTVCLGKLWAEMLTTDQIAGFFKLWYLKNYLWYNVSFLHVVRYRWKLYLNLVIFAGFGQACQGMSKVLQNNKAAISLGRVELFCLFVACCYTSMEATALSCRFSWVWYGMPKVLWSNKSPISLETVVWFCWFFCSYLHLVRYPLRLQKYAILDWHCQVWALSQSDCQML